IGAVLGLGCTSKTTPFPDSCRPMPRADHLLKLLVLDRGMIKAEKWNWKVHTEAEALIDMIQQNHSINRAVRIES
ncbi:hypothetical protein, partial [Rhabdochromatium marinum]|uniref:hypothetical protein n=1 Tax=Rhabdochromatium marinum TaxID=48729 RepID=UPI001A90CF3E